jgi:hypothetical protein
MSNRGLSWSHGCCEHRLLVLERGVEMVSRRVDWLARSQVPIVGDASCSSATYLWLTRGIANWRSFHNVYIIDARSWVSARGYRYLVGVAQHVTLIEAWVSTVA